MSPSISLSPSPGYELYSRQGGLAVLPANDTDLATGYSAQDYLDVDAINGVRVALTEQEYLIHQFKDFIGGWDSVSISCNARSDMAPTTATVYLQAYNRNTTTWDNLTSNSTAGADEDFNLNYIMPDVTDYISSGGIISCRVYQYGGLV